MNFSAYVVICEDVFGLFDRLKNSNLDDAIPAYALLWLFYKTNQYGKGIVSLHRFYEDTPEFERILNDVRAKLPKQYSQAESEIHQAVANNTLPKFIGILTNFFTQRQRDQDLSPRVVSGPVLPQRRLGSAIQKQPVKFGLPAKTS